MPDLDRESRDQRQGYARAGKIAQAAWGKKVAPATRLIENIELFADLLSRNFEPQPNANKSQRRRPVQVA